MSYLLGVDAGNSKTVAVVAQTDGTVVGWARGGGGDIYVSETGALVAVMGAVDTALHMAAVSPQQLSASCLSLVGADWPEDFAFWQREVARRGLGERSLVVNDALGALRAGSPSGEGGSGGLRHGCGGGG